MRPGRPSVRHASALAALAVSVALTACGSADDDDAGGASTATSEATDGSVTDDSVTDVSLVPATQPSVPEVSIPTSIPTELVVTELTPGTGTPAAAGDTVFVNYVGVRSEDGEQFDSNYGGDPFPVTLGAGSVIQGWDEGLVGATAGERLQLDIPADLAYGDEPRGDVIQAGDALTFVIDVVAVVPAGDPAGAPTAADIPTSAEAVTEPKVEDVRPGDGATLEMGQTGVFHLVAARGDDGTVLSSTWDAMEPQTLAVTPDGLVPGLADSLVGMQVGGRRVITLPADESSGLTPGTDVVIIADLLAVL
jgi:peptidylprolyl isomerase